MPTILKRSTASITGMRCWNTHSQASESAVDANIQITRANQPSKKRFAVRRVSGSGDLWVTEYIASWSSAATRLHGKHSTLRILSRRAPGAHNGSNGWTRNHETRPSFRGERLARTMGRTDGHVTTKRDSGSLRNRQLDFITGRAEVAVICPRARSIEWIRCGYYIEAVRPVEDVCVSQRIVG
jgi:hypothetical protein